MTTVQLILFLEWKTDLQTSNSKYKGEKMDDIS